MFEHQGPGRSDRQNRLVAGYLAFVGGFVNSAGFVLLGTFTSHVTGNIGRLAHDIATSQVGAAATALTMLIAFVSGAFVASMAIESSAFGKPSNAYAAALFAEALLLSLFTAGAQVSSAAHPRIQDLEAAILCGAMGIQNSLVTRLSGAVVRTTHLTGVFTDLGIEGARWFRWWRSTLSEALKTKLSFGRNPAERPAPLKVLLLLTIAGAFSGGALAGAFLGLWLKHQAMLIPITAVATCGLYALLSGRAKGDAPARHARTRR